MDNLNTIIHGIESFARKLEPKNPYSLCIHRGLGFKYGAEYSDEWFDPDKELPKISHWYSSVVVVDKEKPYTLYYIRGDIVWRSDKGTIINGPWENQMLEIATELYEQLRVRVLEKQNAEQRQKEAKAKAEEERRLQYEQSVREKWDG